MLTLHTTPIGNKCTTAVQNVLQTRRHCSLHFLSQPIGMSQCEACQVVFVLLGKTSDTSGSSYVHIFVMKNY
jgi:hypothetical protein